MKLNRLISAVLSAALLTGLCACGPHHSVVGPPTSGVSASARPSPSSGISENPDASQAPPDGSTAPDPSTTEYDENHRLDAEIPALIDGLELPIAGASGYTSVSLPVYSSIPGTTTTPSTPQPEPSPNPTPDVTEPPESDPVETPEPTPVDPVEPDPVEPDPGDPGSSGQEPEEPEAPSDLPPETPSEPEQEDSYIANLLHTTAQTPASMSAKTLSSYAGAIAVWEPGVAFVILEENGNWWRVSRGSETGWIENRYCMINLPDVIPSIIYDDANAYSSRFISSGRDIPGVTGEIFYHSLVYNVRLGKQEFVMPILYAAARDICAAQHRALAEGNCLVIYQTFRPYDTQRAVVEALTQLANVDPEVKAGIATPPWSMNWFIATGFSNHQRGYAIDVSMVKVQETETKYVNSYYPYLLTTKYEEYTMPTPMHELSIASRSTISPSSSQLSDTMNGPAIALRSYFTASGWTPLASEWWHFNNLAAMRVSSANPSDGKYYITECLSRLPDLPGY